MREGLKALEFSWDVAQRKCKRMQEEADDAAHMQVTVLWLFLNSINAAQPPFQDIKEFEEVVTNSCRPFMGGTRAIDLTRYIEAKDSLVRIFFVRSSGAGEFRESRYWGRNWHWCGEPFPRNSNRRLCTLNLEELIKDLTGAQ
jgi:hypothetical protein